MTYQTRAILFAVGLTTTVLVASADVRAQAGDWRRWGGAQGDFIADSTGLAESWPATGPPELWSRALGAGHTSMLVDGGRLFTMYRESHGEGGGEPWRPREVVIALDAASGETLWELSLIHI